MSTPMLVDQATDQARPVTEAQPQITRIMLTISLPCGRIAKVNLASRRQTALADVPNAAIPSSRYFGVPNPTGDILISLGFSPSRMRTATSATCRLVFDHRDMRTANNLPAEEGMV